MSYTFPPWYPESASSWTMARAKRFAKHLEPKSGSPIEVLLGASVLLAAYETGFPLSTTNGPSSRFALDQQVSISKYRVDFLISGDGKNLVVECDGRDFHHATRDQIERDRKRDADLAALGYTVFRYPGKQITTDIWKPVLEILSWLDSAAFCAWYNEHREFLDG